MNLIQLLKTKVNIVYAKYLNKDTIEELPIYYIAGSQTLPPPLDAKEEDEALKKLANGDEEVKKILVERNLRLVVYIAKKFDNTGVGVEDLISIGTIGLIKGINTFNGALEDNYKNLYKSRFYSADMNDKSYVDKRRVLDNGLPNPNRDKRYWILEDRSAVGDSS